MATDPFGDMRNMLAQFKMPGVDMAAILESQRKDVEALVEANKSAYEAMQAIARKQTEMMTESIDRKSVV